MSVVIENLVDISENNVMINLLVICSALADH
jgi:hypothetical protein